MLINANHSQMLADTITELLAEGVDVSDYCDLTSTTGYDNDGSTGPELIDNGIRLANAATNRDHAIFYAVVEDTCYFKTGRNDEEACRLLREEVGE